MKTLAFTMAAFSLLAVPALAQTAGAGKLSAKSGEELRVGWIGSVGANCQPNPAPTVTPGTLADHGQIKLQQGEVQTNSFPACPGVKLPAIVVFYTSSPSFKGTDGFSLKAADGTAYSYNITVE
jgi:hypothetical protein